MSRFTAFAPVSDNRGAPRVWIETHRLTAMGFAPGERYAVQSNAAGLTLRASAQGDRLVCSKRAAHRRRPLLDLNSRSVLGPLADCPEIKFRATFGRLDLLPSIRAASIIRARSGRDRYRVLDLCCGGGTSSAAFDSGRFEIVGGVEIHPDYAEEFALRHPDAEILLGNLRAIHSAELPAFDGLFMGVPCTDHSSQGRAKKGLAGQAELGGVGDLYLSAISIVAARMPVFAIFENVPSFGASLGGRSLVSHLRQIGYHVTEQTIDPHRDYGEPTTRRRWFAVALLMPGFSPVNPQTPFTGTLADFLDPEDADQDRADAERISRTMASLEAHHLRHRAKGNRFTLSILPRSATAVPTILRTYPKISASGVYVETPYGARMLRPHEVCRLHGHSFINTDPTTIYQMSGQGVLTNTLRRAITEPLSRFLP